MSVCGFLMIFCWGSHRHVLSTETSPIDGRAGRALRLDQVPRWRSVCVILLLFSSFSWTWYCMPRYVAWKMTYLASRRFWPHQPESTSSPSSAVRQQGRVFTRASRQQRFLDVLLNGALHGSKKQRKSRLASNAWFSFPPSLLPSLHRFHVVSSRHV